MDFRGHSGNNVLNFRFRDDDRSCSPAFDCNMDSRDVARTIVGQNDFVCSCRCFASDADVVGHAEMMTLENRLIESRSCVWASPAVVAYRRVQSVFVIWWHSIVVHALADLSRRNSNKDCTCYYSRHMFGPMHRGFRTSVSLDYHSKGSFGGIFRDHDSTLKINISKLYLHIA